MCVSAGIGRCSTSHTPLAVCSLADEMAALAGRDSLEYLRELIGLPRKIDLKAGASITQTMAPRSSFIRSIPDGCAARLILPQRTRGQPLPSRRGRGIAVDRSFVTYVAAVVQVAISDDGHVSVPRIDIWPSIAAWR
jgi:isoquinoline 1-oxidoreductase beta subunit